MYLPFRDTMFSPQRLGCLIVRPADTSVYMGISTTLGTKRWLKMAKITNVTPSRFGESGEDQSYDASRSNNGHGSYNHYHR
jgi:hypothetical protein